MKKLIPLMFALALTFGAVSMYAGKSEPAAKATKSTKPMKKSTKK